jgi:hypothetical protein
MDDAPVLLIHEDTKSTLAVRIRWVFTLIKVDYVPILILVYLHPILFGISENRERLPKEPLAAFAYLII